MCGAEDDNSLRLRLTANPPPSRGRLLAALLDVGGGCCYRVLPQSLTRQLPPGGSLSYCTAQLHGSRLLRWRLSRGTARSRTDSQRKSQDMARPREAIGAKSTPCKVKFGAKGGVQRGQMSPMRIQLPPLALFASFSGLRKKRQHRCQLTKKGQLTLRGRERPPSPNGDTSLGEGGFWLLRWSRLSKGDRLLCGGVSCFSNPCGFSKGACK